MKKLMTMLGAVAMAFGLFAADAYTISFEQAEVSKGVDTSTMLFTPVVSAAEWAWTGDPLPLTAYGTETKFAYGTGALDRRAGFDGEDANDNYLPLSTGADELTRAVGEGNIYLDQLVKFTGFEDPQTNLVEGTKIAIWMSEFENEDESTTTNLYVTVGKVDAVGGVEQIALKVDGTYALDTWYRLSIKSLGNVFGTSEEVAPHAGFLVYVNGQQVGSSDADATTLIATTAYMDGIAKGYMGKGQLFTSIAEGATFATVGYQGIGAVDDIFIDSEGPKFCQTIDVEFNLPTDDEGNDTIQVDYVMVGGTRIDTFPISVPDGTEMDVYFSAIDGKKVTTGTSPMTVTITSSEATVDLSEVVAEDVVAKLTLAEGDAEDLAESELADALAALDEGDVIETVLACETDDFIFSADTTITGTATGLSIFVGAEGDGALEVAADIAEGETLVVEFEDGELGEMTFGAAVAGTLEVVNGLAIVAEDGIELADGAAIIKAAAFDFSMGGTIALVEGAKVMTMDDTLTEDELTLPEEGDYELKVSEEPDEEGYYTYSAAQSGAKVAEIVGGDQYATLADAVAAANESEGVTIKMLGDYTTADNETIVFTKNATLDLNDTTLTFSDGQRDGKKLAVGTLNATAPEVTFENGTIVFAIDGSPCGRGVNVFGTLNVACAITQTCANPTQNGQPIFDCYGASVVNVGEGAVIEGLYGDVFRTKDDVTDEPDVTINITGGSVMSAQSDDGIFYLNKAAPAMVANITGGELSFKTSAFAKRNYQTLTCELDDTCAAKFDCNTGNLADYIKAGYEAVQGEDEWYTIAKIPSFDVTFTVDDVEIPDSATNVLRDTVLTVDMIPDVCDLEGAWDVDPLGAVITETTNFNFTTVKYVTITLPQELPDGVTGLVVSQKVDDVWIEVDDNQIVVGNEWKVEATVADGYTVANPIKSGTAELGVNITVSKADVEGKITPPAADVAELNGVKYKTLGEAIAALTGAEDETIEMLDNYTAAADEDLTFTKSATLDLGEFTLTIPSENYTAKKFGVAADAAVTFENGTIELAGGGGGYGLQVYGTVTIACTFKQSSTNKTSPAFDCYNGAVINAGDDAEVISTGDVFRTKGKEAANTLTLNITGGTFTSRADPSSGYDMFYFLKSNYTVNMNITGGTFNSGTDLLYFEGTTVAELLTDACEAKFKFTSKESYTEGPTLLADGYEYVLGEEGYYTIQEIPPAVCQIGTTTYPTLGAAIAALTGAEDETIELLMDYTAADTEDLTFTKSATLDLGGFTLTIPTAVAQDGLYGVAAGAEVTFTNGTVDTVGGVYNLKVLGTATIDCTMKIGVGAGSLPLMNIYGGTVIVNEDAVLESCWDVFRTKDDGYTSTVVINGGSITAAKGQTGDGDSGGVFYHYKNHTLNVTINDGIIDGGSKGVFCILNNAPMNCTLDDNCKAKFANTTRLAAFIAPGYELVQGDDDWYTIQKIPSFTVAAITVENAKVEATNKTAQTVLALPATVLRDTEIAVTVTPNADYEYKTTPAGWIKNENGSITTNATVTADLAITVEAPTKAAADPVDPETPKHYNTTKEAEDAAKAINDNKATMIKTPTGAVAEDYTELFTAVVKGTDVVVELNEGGTNALETAAATIETAVAGKLGDIAAAAAGSSVEVLVTDVEPGFWYGVAATAELTEMGETEPAAWQQATTEGVTLTVTKPATGNAAFFQTRAKVKAPVAEEPGE